MNVTIHRMAMVSAKACADTDADAKEACQATLEEGFHVTMISDMNIYMPMFEVI